MTKAKSEETTMPTTTHAPKQIDPSASLHAEALGRAKSHGRLRGRRIIVVGAGQRIIVEPTIRLSKSRPKAARPLPISSTPGMLPRLRPASSAARKNSAGSTGWRSMLGFRRACRCRK
jgi:hypothetical protein